MEYLPATKKEMRALGWDRLDVILVTGDAYIDSPFIGVAVIGRVLADAGFKVGIIAQPGLDGDDICRLGEPGLFWGISGGCIDSMVANRTASGYRRKSDDYTPGGLNNRRPDRAVLAYANLIRRHFKNTVPLVLGGIEASLRRVAHYDYWTNRIRRSILFDAKADYLLYGMAERAVVELATCLRNREKPHEVRGLCYIASEQRQSYQDLPSFEEVKEDKKAFCRMFALFYANNDPVSATGLCQPHAHRFLIQNPPQPCPTVQELDHIYELDYQLDVHPFYAGFGRVKALETIRFSITTHRGCYGECNFCAIAVHQGRTISSRSRSSIVREAGKLAAHPQFKGMIHDVGGPTANMYGFECTKKLNKGPCPDKRCIFPKICKGMPVDHGRQLRLLDELRSLPGIKKIVVSSGIRYDMILEDKKNGLNYLKKIIRYHVSGQMKIAPEHCLDSVLDCMGKPGAASLIKFRQLFNRLTRKEGLKQFLTYYIIAAHPGCTLRDMRELKKFAQKELKLIPRQVQIFTPTPSTWSTLMYWTAQNPFTGKSCFVEKSVQGREKQKQALLVHSACPQKNKPARLKNTNKTNTRKKQSKGRRR